ncbi:hypothetical protein Bbelb_389630 [Branchiostoma belcheri]|nr:hypothetical protein Bbelb_389630 [Branchiostoma belcheri]
MAVISSWHQTCHFFPVLPNSRRLVVKTTSTYRSPEPRKTVRPRVAPGRGARVAVGPLPCQLLPPSPALTAPTASPPNLALLGPAQAQPVAIVVSPMRINRPQNSPRPLLLFSVSIYPREDRITPALKSPLTGTPTRLTVLGRQAAVSGRDMDFLLYPFRPARHVGRSQTTALPYDQSAENNDRFRRLSPNGSASVASEVNEVKQKYRKAVARPTDGKCTKSPFALFSANKPRNRSAQRGVKGGAVTYMGNHMFLSKPGSKGREFGSRGLLLGRTCSQRCDYLVAASKGESGNVLAAGRTSVWDCLITRSANSLQSRLHGRRF